MFDQAGTCLVSVNGGSAAEKQQDRGMSWQWFPALSAGIADLSFSQQYQGDVAGGATAQY